jgi:cytochrome c peroxidase
MKKCLISLVVVAIFILQSSLDNSEPETKEELGKLLFSDRILSRDGTISCASCHIPLRAFADSLPVSVGVKGRKGTRNTPSSMNLRLQRTFFWDGRAKTLEEQALFPIKNPDEMDLPIDEAVKRLNESPSYRKYFCSIFGGPATPENLAEALAAFERTQETSNSPFDIWKFYDDSNAVSAGAKRGFNIFSKKGKCTQCHFGADFTAQEFRNIGLFNGKKFNDSGRIVISGVAGDLGKFKTPGLRNIAVTAPYMHNGVFQTLAEVIEFYDDPSGIVPDAINRDTILNKPLGLTVQEKKDLEEFLNSLTDKRFVLGHSK